MTEHEIAMRLRRLATIRERQARAAAARAAREVAETEEALETLDGEHADSEARVLAPEPAVDGARLQLLGLGRDVYLGERQGTAETLAVQAAELDARREHHRDRLGERHGKDELYRVMRQRLLQEMARREQKELDEIASGRHGRDE